MPVKIGVVVPVRNCLEYTQATVASLQTCYEHQFYFVDDHSDAVTKQWLAEQKEFVVFTDPIGSTGLAWNWNLGISAALNDSCTHILVINNDILLHPDAVDAMVQRFDQGDVIMVSGDDIAPRVQSPEDVFSWQPDPSHESYYADYSCFMIVPETIAQVGWFDEDFVGAYFEDNDYTARVVRADLRAARLGAAPLYHYHMRTSLDNPADRPLFEERAARNSILFQQKWGCMPATSPDEISRRYYQHAYNAPSPSIDLIASRLQDMYRHAQDSPSAVGIYSNPLYRLASTVQSVAVLGDIGESGLCALICAKPCQLLILGMVDAIVKERIMAAARFAGVDLVYRQKNELQEVHEPVDLLLIIESTLEFQRVDIGQWMDNARQYVVVYTPGGLGIIPYGKTKNEMWCNVSAYVRKYPVWLWQNWVTGNSDCIVLKRFR